MMPSPDAEAEMTSETNTEMTFEQAMQRLEEIIRALESGELSLAESMALYKEGAAQSRLCRQKLEQAKLELELWQDGKSAPLAAEDLDQSSL